MKWYSWINWMGVALGICFFIAVVTDNPWVLVGWFVGALFAIVEMWVTKKEQESNDI